MYSEAIRGHSFKAGLTMETNLIQIFTLIYAAVIGYFLGSLNGAQFIHHYIARYRGVHPTRIGTKNAGTQNVWMMIGRIPAFFVFAIDFLKGFLSVWFAHTYLDLGGSNLLIPGLFAIAGHNWPIFFHLRGGRGVATLAGIFAAFDYQIALFIIPFVVPFILFRIAGLTPFVALTILGILRYRMEGILFLIILILIIFVIIIRRLQAEWSTLKTAKRKFWTLKNIIIYDRAGANPPKLSDMFDFL